MDRSSALDEEWRFDRRHLVADGERRCSDQLYITNRKHFSLKTLFLKRLCFVLAVNLDMRSGSSWILANINVTGYYRVNYDLGNWERLLAQLMSDHQVMSGLF